MEQFAKLRMHYVALNSTFVKLETLSITRFNCILDDVLIFLKATFTGTRFP